MNKEWRTHNSTFAIGGVSYSADSFVVTESSVLRINICSKKPAHRKSAKHYLSRLLTPACQLLGLAFWQLVFCLQRILNIHYFI